MLLSAPLHGTGGKNSYFAKPCRLFQLHFLSTHKYFAVWEITIKEQKTKLNVLTQLFPRKTCRHTAMAWPSSMLACCSADGFEVSA